MCCHRYLLRIHFVLVYEAPVQIWLRLISVDDDMKDMKNEARGRVQKMSWLTGRFG